MKRIVKETKKSGTTLYRVETNEIFFGLLRSRKWRTCSCMVIDSLNNLVTVDAVFDTLEEAESFCGIDQDPVIKSEIIQTVK